jgi:hypothetical protein
MKFYLPGKYASMCFLTYLLMTLPTTYSLPNILRIATDTIPPLIRRIFSCSVRVLHTRYDGLKYFKRKGAPCYHPGSDDEKDNGGHGS